MSRFEYAQVDPGEVIRVLESIREEYVTHESNWYDYTRMLAVDYAISAIKNREDDLK